MKKTVQIELNELLHLFQQGTEGNAASFVLLARRMVSKLKKTDTEAAEKLAESLSQLSPTRNAISPVDVDSRQGLLREEAQVVLDYEPIWPPTIAADLLTVLQERRLAPKLRLEGLEPAKALLFKGPPGVGKTMACRWLARELQLPLLTLDLATVMSSLLGKTGSNIRAVVDYARSFPCILLLDEFDSIAKRRDDERDVGELKRLVTVLLQSIDEWPSTSLLVAATNHPELLDPAVWRRFDLQLDFKNPSADEIRQFLEIEGLSQHSSEQLSNAFLGNSYADLRRILLSARKKSVITESSFEGILENEALQGDSDSLRDLRVKKLASEGFSQRKIAQQLGISHPTVGRILKEAERI